MSYRPCVSVVVLNPSGEILLVHKPRKLDDWQLPQGGIEEGETTEEAARRELREETGIDIDVTLFRHCPETYRYDYPEDFKRAGNPKHEGQLVSFVAATVPAGTEVCIDGKELDDCAWVKPDRLEQYIRRKKYRSILEDIMSSIS